MEINVLIEENLEKYLEEDWLRSVTEHILAAQETGSSVELGLVITSQERVQQLNWAYRERNEPTDVLAFSSVEEPRKDSPPFVAPPDGVLHLGEVVISYHQAVIQAEEHRHPVKKEVAILIIHGVLHLLGYDHDKPEPQREMWAREREILSRIEGQGLGQFCSAE